MCACNNFCRQLNHSYKCAIWAYLVFLSELASEFAGTARPFLMKIYVDTVRRFCRPKNTDWQYNFILAGVSRYHPELEFVYPLSVRQEAWVNGRYLAKAVSSRVSRRWPALSWMYRETFVDRLNERELAGSGCQVIFSHRDFPANAGRIPVVWQNSVLDPEMSLARGIKPEVLDEEFRLKRKLFARARLVQVSTMAEARRLGDWMPEIADRFRAVPFFLPYLEAADEAVVRAKHADAGTVEFVFVGREAHRKGLPELLAALESLDFGNNERASLTIVSDFRDGSITLPNWTNLKHESSLNRTQVVALFDRSHILLMPSRFESYGFVYLEAMSRGVVPVVPDWEVQREIVDGGECGMIVRCQPASIADAVRQLIVDDTLRQRLAMQTLRRFGNEYAPSVVADRYAALFGEAVS